MRRCCAEERPIFFYKEDIRYLFVQDGVFRAPGTFLSTQFRGFVWTLVNADENGDGVPDNTRHLVIYTTSPAQSRWARVHKTIMEYLMVMNPWTRKEILRA